MIETYIIAILIILGMLTGWIAVQHWARGFAARHPEFGPVREDGEGCGGLLCLCKNRETCSRYILKNTTNPNDTSSHRATHNPLQNQEIDK